MRLIAEDGSEEWEPGGTLGNDERFVAVVKRDANTNAMIDTALGMQQVELRLPTYVMDAIAEHAAACGVIPHAMIRQILEDFVKDAIDHEAVVYVP